MYSLLFFSYKKGSKLTFWEKVQTEPDDDIEVIEEEEETEQTVQMKTEREIEQEVKIEPETSLNVTMRKKKRNLHILMLQKKSCPVVKKEKITKATPRRRLEVGVVQEDP